MADISGAFNRPFKEQADFFRRKLNLPTARWDDIKKAAHDRAFIVAGAMKADLINDLHRAVEGNINAGKSVDDFRKDFRRIVEQRGWHGWTGEGTKKGEAWRTRVIFETNLRASYAAGRHAQLTDPGLLARRPWWQYVHSGHEHARPQHKAWGDSNLTLRHDDPFWDTHYPPNGWGCGCTARAVPDGSRWQPLSPVTLALRAKRGRGGAKPLVDTGTLKNSVSYRATDRDLTISVNREFAAVHQFGTTRAGRGRKTAIPARPFLGLSDADIGGIERTVARALQRSVE